MIDRLAEAVAQARASVEGLTLDGVRRVHAELFDLRDEVDRLLLVLEGMERLKLAEEYGAAAGDDSLLIWELSDREDPTGVQRDIARVMGRRPRDAWSPVDVWTDLKARRDSRVEAIQTVMRRMAQRGYLRKTGRGRYVLARRGEVVAGGDAGPVSED
jgi:hypothetical protein